MVSDGLSAVERKQKDAGRPPSYATINDTSPVSHTILIVARQKLPEPRLGRFAAQLVGCFCAVVRSEDLGRWLGVNRRRSRCTNRHRWF